MILFRGVTLDLSYFSDTITPGLLQTCTEVSCIGLLRKSTYQNPSLKRKSTWLPPEVVPEWMLHEPCATYFFWVMTLHIRMFIYLIYTHNISTLHPNSRPKIKMDTVVHVHTILHLTNLKDKTRSFKRVDISVPNVIY